MDEAGSEPRKSLVIAAEEVMRFAFTQRESKGGGVGKSQLNQLIGVCGEAVCAEEIENYLRYQASRDRPSWDLELVERTIAEVNKVRGKSSEDRERVEAWRLYAVYLARAFTYRNRASGEERRDRDR